MSCLDRAAEEIVTQWTVARDKDRSQVLANMEKIVALCEEAVKIWEGYLKSPGAPGDKFAIVSWVGPDRAKQLHDLSLSTFDAVEKTCGIVGTHATRSLALEPSLIEMAYRMLRPGETGPDYAKEAIDTMQTRIKHLRELMQRVKGAKLAAKKAPAKGSAKSASAAKPSKSKAAAKAAKKPAPRPKKKSTGKTVKKSAAKTKKKSGAVKAKKPKKGGAKKKATSKKSKRR